MYIAILLGLVKVLIEIGYLFFKKCYFLENKIFSGGLGRRPPEILLYFTGFMCYNIWIQAL